MPRNDADVHASTANGRKMEGNAYRVESTTYETAWQQSKLQIASAIVVRRKKRTHTLSHRDRPGSQHANYFLSFGANNMYASARRGSARSARAQIHTHTLVHNQINIII